MIYIAHTIEKKPELEIQLRHTSEDFEERIGSPATHVRCHPSEVDNFKDCGLLVIPDLTSKMVYWLGKE